MEVILLDKVFKLGSLGDQVKVRPGYARNFLIPQCKAVVATQHSIGLFEARRAELQQKLASAVVSAQERLRQLAELGRVQVTARAGSEGRLFGSVGARDIAEAITAAGVEITKGEIHLATGALRRVGEHEVVCQLHAEVRTQLIIEVVAEA